MGDTCNNEEYKDLLLERKEILRSNGFINKLQPRFEAICERLQEIDNETQKKLWGEVVLKDSEDEDIDFSFRDTSENVFQEEYERQKQEGFCVENVDGMTNFVFTNRFGMPHNPAAVNRAIKRIVDTHNSEEEVAAKKEKREPVMIPRFSCHIFRHTFASRFCENETNIKVIQEVMGHADVSTTMNIYAEANPDVTRSVIEKLSKNMDIF